MIVGWVRIDCHNLSIENFNDWVGALAKSGSLLESRSWLGDFCLILNNVSLLKHELRPTFSTKDKNRVVKSKAICWLSGDKCRIRNQNLLPSTVSQVHTLNLSWSNRSLLRRCSRRSVNWKGNRVLRNLKQISNITCVHVLDCNWVTSNSCRIRARHEVNIAWIENHGWTVYSWSW